MRRYRLGIWASHPIQYYAPWFRHLAKQMDIEVFYAYQQNAKGQSEAGFGVEFDWDTPLLEGYPYRWLRNTSPKPSLRSFGGCDTPEIYEIVREEKFDAFLIFGWNRKSALQTILACRRNKIPILMRGDSNLLGALRLKSTLKYFPYRWFLPRLDAYLYVGARNKAYLKHYGVSEDHLFFCPHFVDGDFFSQSAKEAEREGKSEALRNQFGIPKGAFVFLFAGKMIPKKRPADFLQAGLKLFAQKEGAGVHLLFVGDGPLRPSLESLAKAYPARIHFAGFQNQSQMPIFYRASDTLILPSNGDETWGLVVNEAFACGIPAIVSDTVGCAPDLIEEGKTGHVYPTGDVEKLADRMLRLKAFSDGQSNEIQEALQKKTQLYSIERATEGLVDAMGYVNGLERRSAVVHPRERTAVLILGMGASTFGREKRAVSAFKHMPRIKPYFLISRWEDGSVSRLLREHGFDFEKVPFGYLGRARLDWSLITLLHLPELYYRIFKSYRQRKCRTILFLSINALVNAFPAILFLNLFAGAKLVFYLGDIPRNNVFHRFLARLTKLLNGRFIVNSFAVQRGLATLGIQENKIRVIYNGVDTAIFERAEGRDLRKEFGWQEASVLVGFVGQVNPKKGVSDFIDAARRVLREEPRCRFLIFGKGGWQDVEWQGKLAQMIRASDLEEQIVFAGWRSGMETIYKALDIVVVPSRHEDPAPNVCIEATAAGKPVIATRVGGCPELIEAEVTGFIVDKESPLALASSILRLAKNQGLTIQMGEAGKKRAAERFDIKKNAALVEELLWNETDLSR